MQRISRGCIETLKMPPLILKIEEESYLLRTPLYQRAYTEDYHLLLHDRVAS
jgi:hypothetical protein